MTLTKEEQTTELRTAQAVEEAAPIARPISVLVVEDDEDAANLVRFYLYSQPREFVVELCGNLTDAMQRLTEPGIDVVLLDLGLPELSGYKSFRAVLQSTLRLIPVVIWTGDDNPLSQQITMSFGAADYLIKNETSSVRLRQALCDAVLRWALRPSGGGHPAE